MAEGFLISERTLGADKDTLYVFTFGKINWSLRTFLINFANEGRLVTLDCCDLEIDWLVELGYYSNAHNEDRCVAVLMA